MRRQRVRADSIGGCERTAAASWLINSWPTCVRRCCPGLLYHPTEAHSARDRRWRWHGTLLTVALVRAASVDLLCLILVEIRWWRFKQLSERSGVVNGRERVEVAQPSLGAAAVERGSLNGARQLRP